MTDLIIYRFFQVSLLSKTAFGLQVDGLELILNSKGKIKNKTTV